MKQIIVCTLLLAAGCGTPAPRVSVPAPPPLEGVVVRVVEADQLVIARCARLPRPGTEATVLDGSAVVARIRFQRTAEPPFVAADILRGTPRPGDRVIVDAPGGAMDGAKR